MSIRRPEPHVAQQLRRDRLRIIQSTSQQLQDFPSNLEQLPLRPGTTSDLLQVRSVSNANMLYEPAYNSSDMVNFSTASNPLAESSRLMTMPHFASSSFQSSLQEQCEVRNLSYWRNSGSHQLCDWMPNYASSSGTNESNPNPNSIFGVEINNELTGVRSSSLNNPNVIMQDIIKSASFSGQGSETTQQTDHGIWVGNGNQLFFVPNYGIQSNQLRSGNPNSCTNRTIHSDESSGHRVSDSNNQGLSLSLSSNSQCSKPVKSVSNHSSNAVDRTDYRNVGPLGPFTGYATILKNSNFLKPAQELLEEICGPSNEKLTKAPDFSGGVGASTSADVANATIESGVSTKNGSSGASSFSMLQCSNVNENRGDGGNRSSSSPSSRPEYQQRMAKFLYMQEEVIRRYRQHQQQMQMVIPSFESVAGLSSATPYISKALKAISRHFRCLENAISDQVKHIRGVLGEELPATTCGGASPTSSDKHDISNIARQKFLDQSFQKNKFIASGTGYVEHQQLAWRPQQKGLPERAVSVLRAWLFDHFLHPYPTDADKHMLAARTGLTRNQVSNWFINARVRVWKPMVEEIHMLETKGLTIEKDTQNAGKSEGPCPIEGGHQPRGDQPLRSNQLQCVESRVDEEMVAVAELNSQQWNQEKRSTLGCHVTPSTDGTLMGFVPYRRAEVEVGGAGPVSLTLALKHGDVEAIQQHHHQLSRHFGGHLINDFVGQ
ncbi:hypothetical protein QN277_008160 [Acacia crassicarpa]|uniref:Homeobox domain-containing protein n=1 Tax=Acacia crassicarpa TaxID=499986 RepID=A0AAE1IQY2_9FABA|nr:hypothetical protein QN277_008160 [Acacia crassicarpa]